jgi:hypothetical protein
LLENVVLLMYCFCRALLKRDFFFNFCKVLQKSHRYQKKLFSRTQTSCSIWHTQSDRVPISCPTAGNKINFSAELPCLPPISLGPRTRLVRCYLVTAVLKFRRA